LKKPSVFILLLIPLVIVVLVIFVYPLLDTFWLSFFEFKAGRGLVLVGTSNFNDLFSDPVFFWTIIRTFAYMVGVVAVNFVLGMGFALLTYKPFRGVSLLRTIILLPMLFIPAAAAVIWALLYDPLFGLVNHLLEAVGLNAVAFLGIASTAMPAVMVTDIWGWTPFVYLIIVAGLQGLPTGPFEAAEIDGASSFQKFRRLTIPMLRPVLLIAVLIKAIDTFRAFDYIWIMTGGGPGDTSMLLTPLAYRAAFMNVQFGHGSAIAVVFFLLSLVLTVAFLYFYLRGSED
jgi:multiple sugar transport system permease protein